MLPARTLDAFVHRKAETVIRAHLLLPLEIRRLVMNSWIPNEVQVEEMPQEEPFIFFRTPRSCVALVEILQDFARIPFLPLVLCSDFPRALAILKPTLHPHPP